MFTNEEMEMSFANLLDPEPSPSLPPPQKFSGIPHCDCGMWEHHRETHSLKCSFLWYLRLEFYKEGGHLS